MSFKKLNRALYIATNTTVIEIDYLAQELFKFKNQPFLKSKPHNFVFFLNNLYLFHSALLLRIDWSEGVLEPTYYGKKQLYSVNSFAAIEKDCLTTI